MVAMDLDNSLNVIINGLDDENPEASDLADKLSRELRRINQLKGIMTTVYDLSLDDPQKLNNYEGFSEEVYGEFNFDIVSDIVKNVPISPSDVFIDLGSGVGQVVLQVAAQANCKMSYGIEKRDIPHGYAKLMKRYFREKMDEAGLPYGRFKLMQGDFLEPAAVKYIHESSVIFVNNYAFPSVVNHALKDVFKELKDGTVIVSSASFCPLNFRLSDRTTGDIGAIMDIKQIKFQGEGVSWTNKHIDYYIQTIDRKRLEQYYREKLDLKKNSRPEKAAREKADSSSDESTSDAEWQPSSDDDRDSGEERKRKRRYSYSSSSSEEIPSGEDDGIEQPKRVDPEKEKRERRREYEKKRRQERKMGRARSQSGTPVPGSPTRSRSRSRSPMPPVLKKPRPLPGPSVLGRSDGQKERQRVDSSSSHMKPNKPMQRRRSEEYGSHASTVRQKDSGKRPAHGTNAPPHTAPSTPKPDGLARRTSIAVEVPVPVLSTDPVMQNFLLNQAEQVNKFLPSHSAKHQLNEKEARLRHLQRRSHQLEEDVQSLRTNVQRLTKSKLGDLLPTAAESTEARLGGAMRLVAQCHRDTQRAAALEAEVKELKAIIKRPEVPDEQRRRQKRLVRLLKATFSFVGLDVRKKWAERFDRLDGPGKEEQSARLQEDFKAAIKETGFLRDENT